MGRHASAEAMQRGVHWPRVYGYGFRASGNIRFRVQGLWFEMGSCRIVAIGFSVDHYRLV